METHKFCALCQVVGPQPYMDGAYIGLTLVMLTVYTSTL